MLNTPVLAKPFLLRPFLSAASSALAKGSARAYRWRSHTQATQEGKALRESPIASSVDLSEQLLPTPREELAESLAPCRVPLSRITRLAGTRLVGLKQSTLRNLGLRSIGLPFHNELTK